MPEAVGSNPTTRTNKGNKMIKLISMLLISTATMANGVTPEQVAAFRLEIIQQCPRHDQVFDCTDTAIEKFMSKPVVHIDEVIPDNK